MYREWRLNPPPNWPVAADAVVGLDWRPDPAWGPPPVGWPLWRRRRATTGGRATVPGVGALGLALGAVALVAALTGEADPAPAAPAMSAEQTTLAGPATFPAGLARGWTGSPLGTGSR